MVSLVALVIVLWYNLMAVMVGGRSSGGATKTNLDSRPISILDIIQDSPYIDIILCYGDDVDPTKQRPGPH